MLRSAQTPHTDGATCEQAHQKRSAQDPAQQLVLPLAIGYALAIGHAGKGDAIIERHPAPGEQPEQHRVQPLATAEGPALGQIAHLQGIKGITRE